MQLLIPTEDLGPLVKQIIAEVIEQTGDATRLAWTEAEAAAVLGVNSHVLRDCRLRGEINATRIGKKYIYSRPQLIAFLSRRDDAQDQ